MALLSGIHVQNFRGLRDFKLEGARMFNLFVGPSEIGKTTALEAIFLALTSLNMQNYIVSNNIRGANTKDQNNTLLAISTLFHKMTPLPILLEVDIQSGEDWGKYLISTEISPILENEIVSYEKTSENGAISQPAVLGETSFNGIRATSVISGGIEGEITNMLHLTPEGLSADQIKIEKNMSYTNGDNTDILSGKDAAKYLYSNHNPFFLRINDVITAINIASENIKKDAIVKELKSINPSINDFAIVNGFPHVALDWSKRTIPMHVMGDGIHAILSTLGHLSSPLNRVYLEDEIGLGIYHGALKNFLRAVLRFAKNEGKQIFATTHSKDILIALKELLNEEEDLREDAVCFSFSLDKNDEIQAYPYPYETIDHCIENNIEIR